MFPQIFNEALRPFIHNLFSEIFSEWIALYAEHLQVEERTELDWQVMYHIIEGKQLLQSNQHANLRRQLRDLVKGYVELRQAA
jgi:hypothetical protein